MDEHTLYIKNMVCDRCKTAVRQVLESLQYDVLSVELGMAVIAEEPDKGALKEIGTTLSRLGFELLEDRQQQMADRIKSAIIELVHYRNNNSRLTLSAYLAGKLGSDYSALSKLFSDTTGMTIERFFILQRTERVKELLFYDEMSLSEIAVAMNYSSPAYLSAQFKSVTGMTPTQFKARKDIRLRQLDKI